MGRLKNLVKYNLPGIVVLYLAVHGSMGNSVNHLYAMIAMISLWVAFVAFREGGEGYYPYLLYYTGLALVLQMTLAGPVLIGPDVHLEYYWAQYFSGGDVWEPTKYYAPAAGMGATVIAPLIQRAFHIPIIWTFKVVYPIFFAFVPVLLYYLFSRWVTRKVAFLSCILFIFFPGFLLEMPGIPEGMLAELFLVLTLFLMIMGPFRMRYRIPLIITCGLLASFIHYSMGVILIIYLTVGATVNLFLRVESRRVVGLCCVAILVGSSVYFLATASGAVAVKLSSIYNGWAPEGLEINLEQPTLLTESWLSTEPKGPVQPTNPIQTDPEPAPPWSERYEDLMKTSLGFDFLEVGTLDKVFRILQWGIGLCIPIGLVLLRRNREYWLFASGAVLMLGLCLYPGWSPILNASRFAHLALLLLAPACLVGGLHVLRRPQVFVACLLVPYFLFTSGFVFEVARYDSIGSITIPYATSLSDHRIDLGATITENDMEVMDWIADERTTFPLYADVVGANLIGERIGYRPKELYAFHKYPNLTMDPPYFVFLRERNIRDGTVVIWAGIGQRLHFPFERYDINIDENVVYQTGNARVLEVK